MNITRRVPPTGSDSVRSNSLPISRASACEMDSVMEFCSDRLLNGLHKSSNRKVPCQQRRRNVEQKNNAIR